MKAFEEDGYWYLHVSGGRLGDRLIDSEDIGPLVEAPRLLLEWSVPEVGPDGAGTTHFTRLQAGWVTFTVRRYRFVPRSSNRATVELEVVMRQPGGDEFVNPEPPDSSAPDTWDGGRLVL